MKSRTYLLICVGLLSALFFAVPTAYAQGIPAPSVCSTFSSEHAALCTACSEQANGVWTAIGCIPATPEGLVSKLLGLAMGVAGGIAFLLILLGGFQILTSTGNPEKLNEGRELVGSAITGLLLIMFSLFILRLTGFNILGIPGFG